MRNPTGCQYDTLPDVALAAVRTHQGPLLVDLDETLYLRNSTEDFIDCARPRLIALLLLRVLDLIKPWRLTGGGTRDNWRVFAIAIFFPWTRWIWSSKVAHLADQYLNRELEAVLKRRAQPPVVLTSGFKSIVAPLLNAMRFVEGPLIAARMCAFADRRNGKLHMAIRELGPETVSRSLVITDSTADLELLQNCGWPLRTRWPQAGYHKALNGVYLPGEYVSQIKHPGMRYITNGIIKQDFAFWILSSMGLAKEPITHLVGLLLLLASFWTIYERGYVDNDLTALRYEADPKFSNTFGRVHVATPAIQPWLWALLTGAAGVAVLHPDRIAFVENFVSWVAVLTATYICFLLFNRLDKSTRMSLYPILQLARSASFTVVVPIEPAGIAALGAHALSRWVPYRIYRLGSMTQWPSARPELVRLITFMLLLLMVASSLGLFALLTWSALALLLWNVFRARRDIYAVFKSARRLD
jgi:hypothetical protein